MTFSREINSRKRLTACKAEIMFFPVRESEFFFLAVKQVFCPDFYLKRSPCAFSETHVNPRCRTTTLSKRRLCRLFRSDTRLPAGFGRKNHIFLIYCLTKFRLTVFAMRAGFSTAKTLNARASLLARPDTFSACEQCGRNNIFSFTRLYTMSINNSARRRTPFLRYSISNGSAYRVPRK